MRSSWRKWFLSWSTFLPITSAFQFFSVLVSSSVFLKCFLSFGNSSRFSFIKITSHWPEFYVLHSFLLIPFLLFQIVFGKKHKYFFVFNKPPNRKVLSTCTSNENMPCPFFKKYVKRSFYVGKGKRWRHLCMFIAFLKFYHDYLLIYLFCPSASELLEFWDKVLFIFVFAIFNTMSPSLPHHGWNLIG